MKRHLLQNSEGVIPKKDFKCRRGLRKKNCWAFGSVPIRRNPTRRNPNGNPWCPCQRSRVYSFTDKIDKTQLSTKRSWPKYKWIQESRARKPRDAACYLPTLISLGGMIPWSRPGFFANR